MILVDIYVPAVEKTYDFSLDETCKVGAIIDEVQEMIAAKEKRNVSDVKNLELCSVEQTRRLNHNTTLAENDIRTGTKLILL